jgi:hypothetical protein
MVTSKVAIYETWSDFRSELQKRSGIVMHNKLWLAIKPKSPLPWQSQHMEEALLNLSNRIEV